MISCDVTDCRETINSALLGSSPLKNPSAPCSKSQPTGGLICFAAGCTPQISSRHGKFVDRLRSSLECECVWNLSLECCPQCQLVSC
ncbi:hypothetical protein AVEN_126118-1 [Araneus ventricosus]|uniref:Uncharacterized protein n=1 Tax=Araneus ventricosus TaxID=182803 RepID=A0A4Y2PJ13_ARAVE|nr:hypothetical protein AVEN_126118-1 [Araneus ventricosus]